MPNMDAKGFFEGKKITIMRIGLLGRGVGDAAYMAEQGAQILVVDDASQEVMQPSVDALREFDNITFKFGPYELSDFTNCDLVLKGAGTPMNSPEIAAAHEHSVPVRMSADLFAEISGVTCVGITGTRGKSTVTHMIHAILEQAGIPTLLGGNVRGVSTLALLENVQPEDVAVLELDSWQCQGWGEAKMSPHVAVFTTFFPDHMNYYKDDLDAYLEDKANIFLSQEPQDTLVLGAQCAELIEEKYSERMLGHVITAGAHDLRADWTLLLPGEHNRYDAALAVEACRALNIDDEDIQKALESFKGVPGRLELVRERNGVKIYNDTTATTPDATLAALRALDPNEERSIILIMGGADKNLEMGELIKELPKHAKRVIMLSGTGTNRISTRVPDVSIFDSLAGAVEEAARFASEGDSILLSPAFASFGMFKNEYDRGDQFTALVQKL
ncbi:MAG: UDP-N-acetylmuramoylalanine--D-glutamate ligase [Parcubacteria group bacterium]|nr:UDP-N-acetylmuramoylalanine--D-glutamate ligase [Parcubacteria group bacterium]